MRYRGIALVVIVALAAEFVGVLQLRNDSSSTSTKVIAYEVVERPSTPGGTAWEPLIIVISPDHLNEQDMTLLGLQLMSQNKKEPYAFISVFTNRSAAELRDKVLGDEASEEEQNLYDKAYVAQYTKSSNVGFHQFAIFYDGVMGIQRQTIKY